jgi:predicted AlkP superfamily pyrophosphatase or phosphodiesterase
VNKWIIVVFLGGLVACSKPVKNTKLVVYISIDQMRGDYAQLFEEQLEHGFKELKNESSYYTNVHHFHSVTTTAAGHATLVTGNYPSNHGIVGNTVYNRAKKRSEYSISDSSVSIEGLEGCTLPPVSNKNLLRPSLGDIVKSNDSLAKSFSVSLKDRASILMGGKHCDRAFWFDTKTTQMVSNNSYSSPFPSWAQQYKATDILQKEIQRGWLLDSAFSPILGFTSEDSIPEENDRFSSKFPHTLETFNDKVKTMKEGNMVWNTPIGDQFVVEFAKKLIAENELGKDNHTDVLTMSLSCADVIGHHFGPNSVEVLDYYNQLDKLLLEFIQHLDETVGKDQYLLVLSSDHGVVPMPEVQTAGAEYAKRIGHQEFDEDIDAADKLVRTQFGLKKSLIKISHYGGIEPDLEEATELGIDSFEVIQTFSEAIKEIPYIHEAFNVYDMQDTACDKPYIQYVKQSFHKDFGMLIWYIPEPYCLVDFRNHGTTHGTPFHYDTHVPLYFYGKGVTARKNENDIHYTVDILPTILEYLKMDASDLKLDGKSLL